MDPTQNAELMVPFFAPIVHRREAALIIHSYINFIMLVKKGAENWCKLLTFHAIFSSYFGYYLEDLFFLIRPVEGLGLSLGHLQFQLYVLRQTSCHHLK